MRMLERIAQCQQLAGRSRDLPKSLRKLLTGDKRRQGELEYLRNQSITGTLEGAAQARLEYLESIGPLPADPLKIQRAAEEAFLLTGIEAITAITDRLAEAWCRQTLGELFELLTRDEQLDFCTWGYMLDEAERDLLRELITARRCHGREYKRHLKDNRDWISQATVRGMELTSWFAPEVQRGVTAERTVEITLASDLHNIFLMGSYFNTCLSLGKSNEMSVLSNAYDANKQVVFMYSIDELGRRYVVGRKLVAVSSDLKLLGYHVYFNRYQMLAMEYQQAVDAMAAYCGRLAAACGLELGDEGAPEEIRSHFWYDDGPCAWPEAARVARAESFTREEVFEASC